MSADTPSHLVPKLRFPEFRDGPTWLAPQFADLYSFKRTNTLSRDNLNYETGTIRNIHYGDIHTKFKPLFRVDDEHLPYINPDALANGFDDDALCEEGDIVLADASEDLDDVGKAIEVISLDGERVVAGMHTIVATRRGSVPVVGFGGQLFQSAAVRAGIKKEAQGAKVYGISANRISGIPVPVPPTEAEQKKIADCLGSLDDLIAAEDRKLEALRQHKQGLIQHLFPQEGETGPRLRFPAFQSSPEWKEQLIDEFAQTTTGKRDTQDKDDEGKYPFFVRSQSVERIGTYVYEGEAVLTSGDGVGVGKNFHYINGKFDFHQRVYCICDFQPHVVGRYFYYYFSEHFGPRVRRMSAKNSVDSVRRSMITDMPVPIPDLAEQKLIADCLTSLDNCIDAQMFKVALLQSHKQGLQQRLFPGVEEKSR